MLMTHGTFGGRNRLPDDACRPQAVTIGNFDGIHLGHQAMLARLTARAASVGALPAVLTFEPHPREIFTPDLAPTRLTSLREKLEILRALGVVPDIGVFEEPAYFFQAMLLVGEVKDTP